MNTTHEDFRNTLVTDHVYLVQHIVNQLAAGYPCHVERAELWSAGAAGLVDASSRYEPSTGVPFARYAAIRIRGAIIDATRARDWAPRSVRRNARELSAHRERFVGERGREPSSQELADLLGISLAELSQRRDAAASTNLLHLDQPLSEASGESSFGQQVPEQDVERLPQEALEQRELIGTLRTALAFLPDPQGEVLSRYFFGGELLRDIADSLGVTEARVSQIRAEALNALRAYFGTSFEGVVAVPDNAPGRRRRAAYVARLAEHSTWRTRLAGRVAASDRPRQVPCSA